MAKKRICVVCGKEYAYCPTCFEDKGKPTWMMSYHDANCRKIWKTLSQMTVGDITEAEALDILLGCDLSNQVNFNPVIKNQITELFKRGYKGIEVPDVEVADTAAAVEKK